MHGADRAADALGGLEHGRRVHQRLDVAGVGIFQALGQGGEHRLADGEVAGAGDRHDALAGLGEDVQLAEGRDIVEAGIGAGVGDHHQTVPHQDSATIGHFQSPNASAFTGAKLVANFAGASNPRSLRAACNGAGKAYAQSAASTRNASSTGTPSAVTSRLVSAAMPTMAIISRYSASVMPFARALAVCEWMQ